MPATIAQATIGGNGTTLILRFSEAVTPVSGGAGGLTLTPRIGDPPVTVNYSSGSGSAQLTYTLSRAIDDADTLLLNHTTIVGAGGWDTTGDSSDVPNFTNFPVGNNSTVRRLRPSMGGGTGAGNLHRYFTAPKSAGPERRTFTPPRRGR